MGWAPKWVGVSGGVAAPGTSITSIARYPQHLDLFCVGSDFGIYSTWWDISTAAGGWANWFQVAGGVAAPGTTITVVARNPNRLDLFARPLGIRVAWSGGGAHFLCIMGQCGAGGIDYVTVDDPIYGRSDVNYPTLQTA